METPIPGNTVSRGVSGTGWVIDCFAALAGSAAVVSAGRFEPGCVHLRRMVVDPFGVPVQSYRSETELPSSDFFVERNSRRDRGLCRICRHRPYFEEAGCRSATRSDRGFDALSGGVPGGINRQPGGRYPDDSCGSPDRAVRNSQDDGGMVDQRCAGDCGVCAFLDRLCGAGGAALAGGGERAFECGQRCTVPST